MDTQYLDLFIGKVVLTGWRCIFAATTGVDLAEVHLALLPEATLGITIKLDGKPNSYATKAIEDIKIQILEKQIAQLAQAMPTLAVSGNPIIANITKIRTQR